MLRKIIISLVCFSCMFAASAFADSDSVVIPGDLRIIGEGSGLVFPDGSMQYKATEQGPMGLQGLKGDKGDKGDTGATGPQGPAGQITLAAICAAINVENVTLPSFCANVTSLTISGAVQKGPFLNGTSVTIYELNANLTPTGKTYNVQTNNIGAFSAPNIILASKYVELQATGYYFNEVAGTTSVAPLTLYALVDLTNNATVNINILTHLERNRIKALMANGSSFTDAKTLSQQEILRVFEIANNNVAVSESLDLSKTGGNNDILLAISAITQGLRTEGEISQLLADMISDLALYGGINNPATGSALINGAKYLKPASIKANLDNRYSSLGVNSAAPDITAIVNNFVSKTAFQLTEFITYPTNGSYGVNLLDKNKTDYQVSYNVSMSAVLPKGHSVKVIITSLGSLMNNGLPVPSVFAYAPFDNIGWQAGAYDYQAQTNTFTSIQTGTIDLHVSLHAGPASITVYEEGSSSPTWTKNITVQ